VSAGARAGAWRRHLWSLDHKTIGLQFLVASLAMLLVGGLLAMAVRWQLAWPWTDMPIVGRALFGGTGGVPSPEGYAALFTMHGTIMIFFVVIPLLTGAFGNYLIPLMIGARDMAFPRLNAFSFWIMAPGIACALASFAVEGGAASSGWTAYPPLSTLLGAAPGSGAGQTLWLWALFFSGLSSLSGAINYVVTIATMRAEGMSMLRLPLTVWGLFVAALLQCLALPVLTAATVLQYSDRLLGTGFFSGGGAWVNGEWIAGAGGTPLLWQHLFWFYSHPAVYVMVVPAMGMVGDILSVHARKPVFGYKPMVWAMAAITGLGVLVWGHHMFVSGMSPVAGTGFMLSTILIALPSAVKTFNWIGTVWGGRLRLNAAMLYALGFVSMFVIGGLSGIWMAATPVDVHLHDTYTVVAHFHYIVFGGTLFGVFSALHHWFPKMTGRHLGERLGKLHFFGTFVLTNAVFLPMHQAGFAGMVRRIADPYAYPSLEPLRELNAFITVAALMLFAWQSLFVANLALTLLRPRDAEANPWRAASLEWEAPSPPPHGNFDRELVVVRGPYEYGDAAGAEDWLPQARPRTSGAEASA
jgi:cytochrome c oxidase subunit 1